MTNELINIINNNVIYEIKKVNTEVNFLERTDIIFLYKGGTTLKILFDKYDDIYADIYADTNNNDFFEFFKDNFKRSDSDYVIMINPSKINLSEMLIYCLNIINTFNPTNIYDPNSLEKSISLLNLQGSKVEHLASR